jgi:hypothetical protein
MSRGPGKVERAIEALFGADSEAAYAVEDMCEVIYRVAVRPKGWRSEEQYRRAVVQAGHAIFQRGTNFNWQSKKQHRIAVVRAANNLIRRGANLGWARWSAGRGSQLVLYVPDNVVSYAKARLKSDPLEPWWQGGAWLEAQLARDREYLEPDGAWWRLVEIEKARRAGEEDRVKLLEAQRDADLGSLAAGLRTLLGVAPGAEK